MVLNAWTWHRRETASPQVRLEQMFCSTGRYLVCVRSVLGGRLTPVQICSSLIIPPALCRMLVMISSSRLAIAVATLQGAASLASQLLLVFLHRAVPVPSKNVILQCPCHRRDCRKSCFALSQGTFLCRHLMLLGNNNIDPVILHCRKPVEGSAYSRLHLDRPELTNTYISAFL